MSEIYLQISCDGNDKIARELKKELKLPVNSNNEKTFKVMYMIKRSLRIMKLLKGDEITYGFKKEPEICGPEVSSYAKNGHLLLKFLAEKNLDELDEYFKELSRIEDFKNITAYDVDSLQLQEYSGGKYREGSISDANYDLKYHNICKRFRSGLYA